MARATLDRRSTGLTTRRTVSTTQRRALTLRDRGCVFPGCDRPPGWCEGHHIVPWPAGGPSDSLARVVLSKAGEVLGQSVVVDNRVGASGVVGTEFVARAAPDGYTMFWAIANHTTNHLLFNLIAGLTDRGWAVALGGCFAAARPGVPVLQHLT